MTRRNRAKPKSSVADKIKDLTELYSPTIITLYGKPGTGKTTLASTAPKPQLIIDVKDKGTDSAKSASLKHGEIEVYPLEGFDDIYEVYDYIKENPGKYKSVVIDHVTSLQDKAMDKVKEQENKTEISQRMFGQASGYMKEVISLYKDLTDEGIIPIFIAQDRTDTEGDGEDQLAPEVGPAMMPSLARTLGASSRVIGNTFLQEKVEKTGDMKVLRTIEYRLRLGPNPYYLTKVTRPSGTPCPDYIVNPTYEDIEKIIKGEWVEPKAKPTTRTRKRRRA